MSNAENASKGATAAGSSGAGGQSDLQGRLDKLSVMADQIGKSRSGGRWVRLLVFVLLLAVVLQVFARIVGMYHNVKDNSGKYAEALGQQLGSVMPELSKKLQDMAVELRPEVEKALQDAWTKHGDEIMKTLQREAETFGTNVQNSLKERMEGELKDLVAKHEAEIQETFPQLKDIKTRERIVDSLSHGLTEALFALFDKHMSATLALMGDIYFETIKFLPDKEAQNRLKADSEKLFDAFGKLVPKMGKGK